MIFGPRQKKKADICLPTSWFCQTPYYLSIFRFEGKIMELDFAN